MNSLAATGRLTANAKLSYSQTTGKSRVHFRLAVFDINKENNTLFLDCYMFGRENFVQWLEKGRAIAIQGRLISYEYVDKNGKRWVYDCELD